MNQTGPLVSICIPAYNCDKYINETLNCLCSQTYSNIEIIVVNDGSTDQTAINAKKNTDSRITLLNITNGGAAKARNIAYKHSHGQYIIFFDADDLIDPNFISSQLETIQNRTDSIIISAWGRFYRSLKEDFKLYKELINHPTTIEEWIETYWFNCQQNTPPGRLFIPREIINEAGFWNEELTLNDDFEFFTRIATTAVELIPNPNVIYYYRSGINGLSTQKNDQAYLSLFNSMELSFDIAIAKFEVNENVKHACANLWQSFIYEVYPSMKDKRLAAGNYIKKLGGSNLKYRCGGLTSTLVKLLGWKIVKHLKIIVNK